VERTVRIEAVCPLENNVHEQRGCSSHDADKELPATCRSISGMAPLKVHNQFLAVREVDIVGI